MIRNGITVDTTLSKLEHTGILALEKGDLSTATRCWELQGKFLAMFTDRQEISEPARRELDAAEMAEATELARLRIAQKYGLLNEPVKPEQTKGKVG
jgi:hypothetical protein